jgi:hypothetical protein
MINYVAEDTKHYSGFTYLKYGDKNTYEAGDAADD